MEPPPTMFKNRRFEKPITKLVLAGGGVRGIALCGALETLDRLMLLDIDSVIGTSVGSIVATAMAAKYPTDKLWDLVSSLDFTSFAQKSNILTDTYRLYKTYGWYSSDSIVALVEKILTETKLDPDITLKEMYEKTKIELIITTTEVVKPYARTIFMSRQETPDLIVKEAVRRSCSIPWFFSSPESEGKHFIDGGMFDNFPIDYFGLDKTVLGLTFASAWDNEEIPTEPVNSFKEFTLSVLNGYARIAKKAHSIYNNKILALDTIGISLTDFSITEEQKKVLYDNAKSKMYEYISQHN